MIAAFAHAVAPAASLTAAEAMAGAGRPPSALVG
jgi:hypothetical protein